MTTISILDFSSLAQIGRVFTVFFLSFLESLWHRNFLGKLKGRVNMSRNHVCFTVEEVLAHLDGDFDIPDEGVNSDVEWLDDEDFKEPELILPVDSVVLHEEEEQEINLRTVQIEETDDCNEEVARRRPSNLSVEEFSWSDDRTEIDIPGFSKAEGPNTILPAGALALGFFQLYE